MLSIRRSCFSKWILVLCNAEVKSRMPYRMHKTCLHIHCIVNFIRIDIQYNTTQYNIKQLYFAHKITSMTMRTISLSYQLGQDAFPGRCNSDATYDIITAYLGIDGRVWRRQNERVHVVCSPRTDVRSSDGSCQGRNLYILH